MVTGELRSLDVDVAMLAVTAVIDRLRAYRSAVDGEDPGSPRQGRLQRE
jgi:hypothetical protein